MSSEQEFSGEQSRQIAALIREEIARRRMSRQQLADKAKLSLSTLEKVLGGRRPLTLATAVRVEEALGVSLRRSAPDADAPLKDGVAPDGLGAYSRRGAAWLEGVYVTIRPSFGDKGAIYAYRTEILWDEPSFTPGVSRGGAGGRRVLSIWRSRGAEPVGSRLSRHQPQRPAPADHRVAPDDHRRDVRRHRDAAGRARLAA